MYKTKDEKAKNKSKLKRLYKVKNKFVKFFAKETKSHVTRLKLELIMSSEQNRIKID